MPKKPKDPRGGHSRVYWEIQDSMAWRALSFSSVALYMALRRKLQSTNNGNIEATLATLRHAGFKSPATLAKGVRELLAVGLIDKTRQGGVAWGQAQCSLYRFTDEVVFEQPKLGISKMPATNDWMQFSTLTGAANAITAAHELIVGTRKTTPRKKTPLQKTYRANTETVAPSGFSTTDSVQAGSLLEQKLYTAATKKTPGKPRAASVSEISP